MERKPQIVATLPEHIVEKIIEHAADLRVTKSEYLALIAKQWFSDGCQPVNREEFILRELAEAQHDRIEQESKKRPKT
jgi:hypothetical protein